VQLALVPTLPMVLDECIETPAPRELRIAPEAHDGWARAGNHFLQYARQNGELGQCSSHRAKARRLRTCGGKALASFSS